MRFLRVRPSPAARSYQWWSRWLRCFRPGDDLASRLEIQRQEYFGVARACARVPACQRITTWGFTDRYTWIDDFLGPGFEPLPLGENYERKPAYFGLRSGMLARLLEPDIPTLPGVWLVIGLGVFALFGTGIARRS